MEYRRLDRWSVADVPVVGINCLESSVVVPWPGDELAPVAVLAALLLLRANTNGVRSVGVLCL